MSGFKDVLRSTATTTATNVIRERTGSGTAGDDDIFVDGGTQGIRIGDIVVGAGVTAGL